ncbi:hypothetical protein M8J77_014001 [Diaphorina citri]|nr:hypothetical protein M8J77_014001 [Diaphorina citri]
MFLKLNAQCVPSFLPVPIFPILSISVPICPHPKISLFKVTLILRYLCSNLSPSQNIPGPNHPILKYTQLLILTLCLLHWVKVHRGVIYRN